MPRQGGLAVSPPHWRGGAGLSDLILRAVCASTVRKGMSLAAIKKALSADGYNVKKNKGRIKAAVTALVTKGLLQRVTGSGASGSFRMGRMPKESPARPAAAAAKSRRASAARRKETKSRRKQAAAGKGSGRGNKRGAKTPKKPAARARRKAAGRKRQ
ncbi:histone H1.01-like [Alligator sinensis]|uniref:Histone H1.01-like n=1 Tax=Alligator sinensis TaxID=38654 RepID=A0A3Q0FV22_ALLSI|nr:histone H1.01-like [Alligator sinensis]